MSEGGRKRKSIRKTLLRAFPAMGGGLGSSGGKAFLFYGVFPVTKKKLLGCFRFFLLVELKNFQAPHLWGVVCPICEGFI